MSKTAQTNGGDAAVDNVLAAARETGEQAQKAWARSCEAYAHYYSDLARADDLDAVFAANTKLLNAGVAALLQAATNWPRLGGFGPRPQA